MHTFNPDRTILRAAKVLPVGGWQALDQAQRRLVLRAAWVVSEADGAVSKDELTALDQLASFLELGKTAKDSGVTAVDRGELFQALREIPRDRAFARHLFAAIFLVGMSDGVLLASERTVLEECSRAVGLEKEALVELEQDLHGILYEELLETVFKDGVVSVRERQILNATRKLLGISEETAQRIEEAFRERLVRGDMGAY
jgi:tellurite resistance protein